MDRIKLIHESATTRKRKYAISGAPHMAISDVPRCATSITPLLTVSSGAPVVHHCYMA
jgi:hypothetical protein